ncbi:MAG: hypothetical protein Q9170_007964, partial [Blastenia crenularia]
MLRLVSTRITLTSSDLDWHVRRHEKRLATLEKGTSDRNLVDLSKAQPASFEPKRRPIVDKPPRGQGLDEIPIYSDEPIYSDDPIPRDSQAFWDQILADAGTSTRVQQGPLARSPQVVEPSGTFLESNGSVRLSVRGENEDDRLRAPSGNSPEELLISPRSPVSDDESAASTEVQRLSPISLPSLDGDENQHQNFSGQSSAESLVLPSSKTQNISADETLNDSSLRLLGREDNGSQSGWLNQMDVDGPSDAAPNLRHYSSTSSLQDPEPGTIGMPFGAQARKAELAASRNASTARSMANLINTNSELEVFERSIRGEQAQHIRTRSGGLPRSRLYISEAAASSSPDKYQRVPVVLQNESPVDPSDLPSLSPRHPRRYRRRSQTYSFKVSDDMDSYSQAPHAALAGNNPFNASLNDHFQAEQTDLRSAFPIHDDYAVRLPPESIHLASNGSFSSPGSSYHRHATSSPNYVPDVSRSSHSSSTYPTGMSINSRSVSSLNLPHITETNTPEQSTRPRQLLDRLPTPYGVASRTTSTMPSSPYNLSSTDENSLYQSSPNLLSTPPRTISSTSMHHTPTRLPVYNDNLPAFSQPQTPVGLPRNGLPLMSLQNPFFTAPARAGARVRR